jgi:DNA-directed RNA polymerase specialized sigma24 family protein
MPGQAGENGAVRVSPMDQRGRPISPPVLSAAEEVSRRAIQHADESSVRDLESYLFRAFLRRLNRAKKRQSLLAQVELQAFLSRISWDPRSALEMKIFIDELLTQCDPVMRDFLCRRFGGYSWKEVGRAYRISSHAAESKFSQALGKVRRKLGLK